jgi:PAS domain S-box-containing protein
LTKPYELLFRTQQQSAEALEREQRFLEAVLDNVQSGIIACDANGVPTLANRVFRELHGIPREAALVEPREKLFDLYCADGRTRIPWEEVPLLRALRGEHIHNVELVMVPRTGPSRTFVASGEPLMGKDGVKRGAVLAVHDITDRKRAEETLRASEERYRGLVETIPQLAWRATPGGRDIDCNQRWYEYTGQTPAQLRSHGWLSALHPDDVPRVIERMRNADDSGEPCEVEYRLRAADGTYRWHLARTVPVRGNDGRIASWFGCATDIEDLKQAQEILKLAHDEQMQRHQAELAHVARLSMMGELVASLAHELTQPLHAINGYASGSVRRLRKRSEADTELVAALEQIGHEAVRAAEVIRRVRAFVGKRKPFYSKVSVNHLIEEIIPFSKAELQRRNAKMVLDLCDSLPAVIADPIQIEQVIMNLVRNGLEAMDETPAADRVLGVKTVLHGQDRIEVEVRDRGTGLDEGELEQIFEPFFTTKPEGMGMGLPISRSIIRSHGGEIWAAVNEDRGCSFHFTLPIANKG